MAKVTLDTATTTRPTNGIREWDALIQDLHDVNDNTTAIYTDADNEFSGDNSIESGGSLDIESGATLEIAGTAITSTAAELNILDGVTSTAAELNILDGVTSTAAELNILDGATVTVAELNILDGVTSTAAELNLLDLSDQTETIDSGVATSVLKRITNIDNTVTGAGAITLAAPDATMKGQVKIIEMTVDNGDVTLSLANVVGGSAATTCTWSAVGQSLVLVAGTTYWNVISEGGVALT